MLALLLVGGQSILDFRFTIVVSESASVFWIDRTLEGIRLDNLRFVEPAEDG
ncbi:hypothetical protein H6H03_15560 [Nostoc paludosum FACHB-159]|uniref:Uncharacterized protein n=1 Tax=Nostoc paludosum FACHB-159 TaxID=2692908 RepID=A0ABR8K996_9NOSO|nr:hypothetical protein [Nostoc paludosum]MBD2678915.1 hypothetical protein [Nostoc sp. FACHB-857]MBD2735294.1 hypothetical protein [Nostoc paludosum FACHB-159]